MSDAEYCDCDYSDAEPPEFCNVDRVKARKQFKCDECSGPILAGESYQRIVGKWEGDLRTFRECSPCLEIRRWAESQCRAFAPGRLARCMSECGRSDSRG